MLPRNHPDRIHVAFDDHRLAANAGVALRLGLGELVNQLLDLSRVPGQANTRNTLGIGMLRPLGCA